MNDATERFSVRARLWRRACQLGELKDTLAAVGAVGAAVWFAIQIGWPSVPVGWQPFVARLSLEHAIAAKLAGDGECLVQVTATIDNLGTRTIEVIGYRLTARHFAADFGNPPTAKIWRGASRWELPSWPPRGSTSLVADDIAEAVPLSTAPDEEDPRKHERLWVRAKATERITRELRVPIDPAYPGYVTITLRAFIADSQGVRDLRERACTGSRDYLSCVRSDEAARICPAWVSGSDVPRPGVRFGSAHACLTWPQMKADADENHQGALDARVAVLLPQCTIPARPSTDGTP
jgi:hypothetical protein